MKEKPGITNCVMYSNASAYGLNGASTPGQAHDITSIIEQFIIYEDISSAVLHAKIIITDTASLPEKLPIKGLEYLGITYTDGYEKNSIAFDVISLQDIKDQNSETKSYSMNLASNSLLKNQNQSMCRRHKGSTSEIVTDILVTELGINPNYIIIEDTTDYKEITSPNITPIQFINYLSNDVTGNGDDNYTFTFYQTTKGIYFKSLESMDATNDIPSENIHKEEFIYSEKLNNLVQLSGIRVNRIIDYTVTNMFDTEIHLRGGTWGSNIIAHDIINKQLHISDYIKDPDMQIPAYTDSYSTKAHRLLKPYTNDLDTDNSIPTHTRLSARNSINNDEKTFEINANMNLEVGNNIAVAFPSTFIAKAGAMDLTMSGTFLITKIKHLLTRNSYTMITQTNLNNADDTTEAEYIEEVI